MAAYLFAAVYILPMFPHGGSANELTRWATAASLVEKGSFEISWTEALIGPNVDTAKVGDKTFSNKAPGPAIIAAPFYALTRLFVGPPNASNIRISWFVMRFVLASLPLLLLGIWLYRRGSDEMALATLLFATPLFLYSLLFFSHVLVAVLVYFAFRLVFDDDLGSPKHCLFAGALSGIAVVSEFPAVFAVAVFGLGLLFKAPDRGRRIIFFILGGVPFVILLLIYNNSLFGSPFSFSYAHEAFPEWAEVAGQGFYGIGWPSISNAYLLLFSPSRGLLFSSPILILSVIAFVKTFDRRNIRSMVRLVTVIVGFLVICGHGAAHGGWAFGPRYLIFIIPLLLDPFFKGEVSFEPGLVFGVLLGASLIMCITPALTFPFAPPEFLFPQNDFWMSFLREEGWYVPNLANVLGAASSWWTLMPIFAALAAAIFVVAKRTRRPKPFLTGLTVGAVVVLACAFIPVGSLEKDAPLRRAGIAERFFKPADMLARYQAAASIARDVRSLKTIGSLYWTVADARAYAPDDFPYLAGRTLTSPSPHELTKRALEAQRSGNVLEQERLFTTGRDKYPFARCTYSTNLAVVYFNTNRKELAQRELEGVQDLVDPAALPDCIRSQYLLGSLYREQNKNAEADSMFQKFLVNSEGTDDPDLIRFRKQLKGS